MYLLFLNLCIYYFKFMYLIYRFILFELCLLFLNSCIYVFIIFEFIYLLFLTINCFYVFIHYYFKTCLLLYPFYDLMIFIYNPKELKLTRKQYK